MRLTISDKIQVPLNEDLSLRALLGVVWAAMLLLYARGIINHLPILGDNTDIVLYTIVIIPIIFATPKLIKKFCLADYLFYFLIVSYYLSCYFFFPENSQNLTENAFTCIFCVYTYYFVGRIIDIDNLFDFFLCLSTICILYDLFYFLIYAPGNKNMDEVAGADNMYAAYQVLPHVALLLWSTLEKFKIWKLITLLSGILFMLSCGTRGPLVCLGFFGVIYFFLYMNFKGAIYAKMAIVTISLLIWAFLREIAMFLFELFTELQLSTRIIEKFIIGDLSNDSYRSVLRDKIYDVLGSGEHFWGLGIFGCRNYGVIYPHFMPLDFVCTFGYWGGYILLFLLLLFIGWAFWLTRGRRVQVFILLLFTLGIVKLMLSNSFVLEPYFYMLIGACAKEIISSKLWKLSS